MVKCILFVMRRVSMLQLLREYNWQLSETETSLYSPIWFTISKKMVINVQHYF